MKNFTENPLSSEEQNRAFLVGIRPDDQDPEILDLEMDELASLCSTLGYKVSGREIQKRAKPEPATCIGRGKLEEIKELREDYDFLIFNFEITPKQQKNISDHLKCDVIDRTYLILEIFSRHAQTKEAKTQVELARLNYLLPRLTGMWTHLDREKGGAGVSKGMGEKQINVDRTLIQKEITVLKKRLKKIEVQRNIQKKSQKKMYRVSLVGYTNAGKSSIMNLLTDSEVLVENKLFATLDSTTRNLKSKGLPDLLLSDTVGFIREIPHSLIVSFRSTLKSVADSDLLLHVVDAGDPFAREKIEVADALLKEIEADHIRQILIFNKIDQIKNKTDELILRKEYPEAVFVSALRPKTREILRQTLHDHFEKLYRKVKLVIPYDDSKILAGLYGKSVIHDVKYTEKGTEVDCLLSDVEYRKLGLSPQSYEEESK